MTNFLAIETATEACSIALCHDSEIIEYFEIVPRRHTQLVLPQIDKLLKEAGITIQDIDVICFGQGPGSFTGVRIAASLVQGLSLGLEIPVVPISTLRAIAQQAFRLHGARQVMAYLDARMSEMYWGLFELDENNIMQIIGTEHVQAFDTIVLPSEVSWFKADGYPHALDILTLAMSDFQRGLAVKAEDAMPSYIRNNVV